MTMTKNSLAEMIYDQMEIPKKECLNLIESTFEIIKDELARGNDVRISGFGKWSVKAKKPRTGRNPRTGDAMTISGRKVVTFKCSIPLRAACQE
jgi:integration host factor subunit alpha